jgi:aspartate kinase
LCAEEIQIWTDVDGILSADPRLFPAARRVPTLSFAEGLELAWSGSKKPHPGTLDPARRGRVPIRILSSLRPEGAEVRSTQIGVGRTGAETSPAFKSIACRRNSHLLRIHPLGNAPLGEIRLAVRAAIERARPALLPLGESEGSIHLALDSAEHLAHVLAMLPREIRLEILPGREVVSLISEDLIAGSDLAKRALEAAAGRSPRLVLPEGGEGAPALRLFAEESEIHDVVAHLHRTLFADPIREETP